MENIDRYKKRLEEERAKLETELNKLGRRDPANPENWDVTAPPLDIMQADSNEAADRTEETHIDSIVLDELEMRHRLLLHALKKIEGGTYGTCEICGEAVEEERFVANPAARTCKAHLDKEAALTL